MTAERERGPEPVGDDRSGNGHDPVAPWSDTVPRQLPSPDSSPLRVAQRRGQQAADLRQKLDEKAAATDELREALDELRQVLDVDHPPPAAGQPKRRTRLFGLGIALVVVAAMMLLLLLDQGSGRIVSDGPPNPAPSAAGSNAARSDSARPGATMVATPSGAARPARNEPALRPLPWPGGPALTPPGLATSGPGATTPGTDVQVAVSTDGSGLVVFERIVLDSPTREPLAVAASTLPALNASARVADLQVQMDDVAVPVTPDGPSTWSAAPPSGRTYTRATLRYLMTGAVVRLTPAASGRALGIVTPLTGGISAGRDHPVQVRATDRHVLGISCPTATSGAVCGTRGPAGWTAVVPEGAEPMVVLLQLDTRR